MPLPGPKVYTTCPPSNLVEHGDYLRRVREVSRWSEAAGAHGILVYTDNGLVDPWLTASVVVQNSQRLVPLIAIQPIYMHPYSVAKMIATFAHLHGRRIDLNLLAGGFKNDLVALGDSTPHDERYARTTEYAQIIAGLLSGGPFSLAGRYYQIDKLRLTPSVPAELRGQFLISGSSPAGLEAARRIPATAVCYPMPSDKYAAAPLPADLALGFRVGILARAQSDTAWREAWQRFPADRRGQIAHGLAMKVSDSQWHQQLSELGQRSVAEGNPYWLHPFENYRTFCPYLVGDYASVAQELAKYFRLRMHTLIVDVPQVEEDLNHLHEVLVRAPLTDTP